MCIAGYCLLCSFNRRSFNVHQEHKKSFLSQLAAISSMSKEEVSQLVSDVVTGQSKSYYVATYCFSVSGRWLVLCILPDYSFWNISTYFCQFVGEGDLLYFYQCIATFQSIYSKHVIFIIVICINPSGPIIWRLIFKSLF